MIAETMMRDERTISVENTSYRWAYLVLSYGLLLSTAYRGFMRGEQAWDLMALVVLGGTVATLYQGRQRVLTRRWTMLTMAGMVVAMLIAVLLVTVAR
jgi:hypothetical protein